MKRKVYRRAIPSHNGVSCRFFSIGNDQPKPCTKVHMRYKKHDFHFYDFDFMRVEEQRYAPVAAHTIVHYNMSRTDSYSSLKLKAMTKTVRRSKYSFLERTFAIPFSNTQCAYLRVGKLVTQVTLLLKKGTKDIFVINNFP